LNPTEDRLRRLREREATLVADLERTPHHQDRLDCLARTREQIARLATPATPPPYTVRLVPVAPAPAPAFLTRRQELVNRYLDFVAKGGR
jgi:hypothetical protein